MYSALMDESNFSQEIVLELDSSGGQLGPKVPKEISEDDQCAESWEFYKWGFNARVTSVQQGTYIGEPACLVSFNFHFVFPEGKSNNRFSEAKITATFQPRQNNDEQATPTKAPFNSSDYPVVRNFSPLRLDGPVCVATPTTGTEASPFLAAPTGLSVTPKIGVAASRGVEYLRDYRMKIRGKLRSNRNVEVNHMTIWTLNENSTEGVGIPDLKCAVVLQHSGRAFEGTLNVQAKTKFGLALIGWPWSTPNPLLFNPDISFGEQLNTSRFETLSDEHWQKRCNIASVVSYCRWSQEPALITQETAVECVNSE